MIELTPQNPSDHETIAQTLDTLEMNLDELELQADPAYFSDSLKRLDDEAASGAPARIPELGLAIRSMVAGSWRDGKSVYKYFDDWIVPELQRLGGVINGYDVLVKLEHEVACMLMQTSENTSARREMRRSIGNRDKYRAVMGELRSADLATEDSRILGIVAAGMLAGVASDDRANRVADLYGLLTK